MSDDGFDYASLNHRKRSSLPTSMISLFKIIIGSGILALSKTFTLSGTFFGVALLISCALSQIYVAHLFSKCIRRVEDYTGKNASFSSIATFAASLYAPPWLLEVCVAITCFGFSISYLIVMGQLMPQIIDSIFHDYPEILSSRHLWITVIGGGIGFPLMCKKSLSELKASSIAGNLGILFIALLCFLYLTEVINPGENPTCDPDQTTNDASVGIPEGTSVLENIEAFSTYIFAISFLQNFPSLMQELKKPSQNRIDMMITVPVLMSVFLYIFVALSGYYLYGSKVCGDLLQSFPQNVLSTIARIAVTLSVLGCFPIQMHSMRRCVAQLIRKRDPEDLAPIRYYFLTVCVFLSAYTIAMCVDNLDTVVAFVGATTVMMVSYPLPAFMYITIFANDGWNRHRIACAAIVCISLVLIPTLVVARILILVG